MRAVAWTKETGMVDLGTLADTGDPRYASHNSSYAISTNKLGTLIVGGAAWTRIPFGVRRARCLDAIECLDERKVRQEVENSPRSTPRVSDFKWMSGV